MQVLYLAEKYMIPNLTEECAKYLRQNLDISNVFCAQQFDIKGLLFPCWSLIDKNTEKALQSSEFVDIQKSVLKELVERDKLKVREVKLFKAVDCWAKEECKRQLLKMDGCVKRQVLGEQIIKSICFPVMKKSEFVDVVLPSKILTDEETCNIMKYFSSTPTSAVGFLDIHRVGSLLRCCRFKSFIHGAESDYENDPEEEEWFPLIVDKDIMLHGVSLLGNDGGKFEVTLIILDEVDEDANDESILASKTGIFISEWKECKMTVIMGLMLYFMFRLLLRKKLSTIFRHQ
ncbi:BTB/POZ domain-containing protein 6-like [Oculina patagonica]